MRRVVEKTGRTYEEAVSAAVQELGIPADQATLVLVGTRDLDRRQPGPEEYTVRAWQRDPAEPVPAAPPDDLSAAAGNVCECSAPTFDEAVQACLDRLGVTAGQADIQLLQMQDTNPLKPGPERVTVRVWRRAPGAGEEPR